MFTVQYERNFHYSDPPAGVPAKGYAGSTAELEAPAALHLVSIGYARIINDPTKSTRTRITSGDRSDADAAARVLADAEAKIEATRARHGEVRAEKERRFNSLRDPLTPLGFLGGLSAEQTSAQEELDALDARLHQEQTTVNTARKAWGELSLPVRVYDREEAFRALLEAAVKAVAPLAPLAAKVAEINATVIESAQAAGVGIEPSRDRDTAAGALLAAVSAAALASL